MRGQGVNINEGLWVKRGSQVTWVSVNWRPCCHSSKVDCATWDIHPTWPDLPIFK